MYVMNILFSNLMAKHFIFRVQHFFLPAGMVASPGSAPEAAKPAQVSNIYINTCISEDDVGFGAGPMCSAQHQRYVFLVNIVQNTILITHSHNFPRCPAAL